MIFKLRIGVLSALLVAALSVAQGGEPLSKFVEETPAPQKDWTAELSSGILFANIRDDRLEAQNLVPIEFTLGYSVDEDSLDDFMGGVFRGHTDFLFRGLGHVILDGQQSRFTGVGVGPRYNFVQPGWKVVPFVEAVVGLGFVDSDPVGESYDQVGLGQDFNFMFTSAAGFRYDIDDTWFLRVSGEFIHISNGGLSEPERKNKPLDAFGPKLSVGCRF